MKFIIAIFIGFSALMANYIGMIKDIKGKVIGIDENNVTKVLKLNSKVYIHEVIETFKNSKVKIVFKDNTQIIIGQNSKFRIDDYLFSKQNLRAKFSFFKGVFSSMTGKIGKIAPKRFILKTKNSLIGVRGTTVIGLVGISSDIIGCSSGVIQITSLSSGKYIILKAGEVVSVFKTGFSATYKLTKGFVKFIAKEMLLSSKEFINVFGKIFSFHLINFKFSHEVNKQNPKSEKNLTIKNNLTKEFNLTVESNLTQTNISKKENNITKTLSWKNYKIEKYHFNKKLINPGIDVEEDILKEKLLLH